MTDGTTYNGAPVYVQESKYKQQMWYDGKWAVGFDYNSGRGGIFSKVMLENVPIGQ